MPVSEVAIGDAFLLGTVFGAMEVAHELTVHGTVSEDLLANVERLGPLWRARRPDRYREAHLSADGTAAGVPGGGPSILCFSGGLDSAYSLHRHTRVNRDAAEPAVGATLMVGGADIPVGEEAAFARALARSKRMTDDLGVPLLVATTNLRAVHQNWSHSCTAVFAALMGLFRARFARGLLAVGFTPREAERWWPQDVTDPPLVSSRAFPIVGDGYEADRFEKLVAILDWPEALRSLRVCFGQRSWSENCGECFKCQILGLFGRIATGTTLPCLPRSLTDEDFLALCGPCDVNRDLRLGQALRHARARGLREPWMDLVTHVLADDGAGSPPDRAPAAG